MDREKKEEGAYKKSRKLQVGPRKEKTSTGS